jgi:phosphoribosylamine--glycine ligase/phosphoribosylaminoimidazole synthetase
MNILLIGSGGREHALAWKLQQSSRLGRLYVAPGNAATAACNVELPIDDHLGLTTFAAREQIHLVLIGPEAPLAAGLSDTLSAAGLKVFGPSQRAAEIEASKSFAKAFMGRHAIPTARFASFSDVSQARAHLRQVEYPIVIKASGLAAGKGVVLPDTLAEAEATLRAIMLDKEFGSAGNEVVIEERLQGEEVSLLCFSDGDTVRVMPPAQDHKRLLDGDLGPNTGGMGAYAPAPICPPAMAAELTRSILLPTIDGLRAEGRRFVGVLYAGLMLTPQGPQVLEYNCRFGDPETQVLMALLETDLVSVVEACVEGRLSQIDLRWKSGAAACVVAAAAGYPGRYAVDTPIFGLAEPAPDSIVFQAGTKLSNNTTVTAGGRVLAATGWGPTVARAAHRAYDALHNISFAGMQYRKDIAARAIGPDMPAAEGSAYAAAGVDIDAGNRAVALMRESVRATYGPEVLAGIGAFGGLYSAERLLRLNNPVLVASTDGVGTKVRLAVQAGRFETIGLDIVNHCVNDILVQGAQPLFFLDYIAADRLQPEMVASVVKGIAHACQLAGCALLGGETAEMPGVYRPNEFDLAGTIVGVVEREHILPRADLAAGDVLIGLPSSGPHTNGFSLIRRIFDSIPLETIFAELGSSLEDALLAPHRSYLPLLGPLIASSHTLVKGLAHITGGGLIENIPRILPANLNAVIDRNCWPVPSLFQLIQKRGAISSDEMFRVFNMGIGMVAILAAGDAAAFQNALPEASYCIGRLEAGCGSVVLQ